MIVLNIIVQFTLFYISYNFVNSYYFQKAIIMKFLTFIFISTILILNFTACGSNTIKTNQTNTDNNNHINSDDNILQTAFDNRQTDIQVHGKGIVTKILADDTSGSKHQKFILQLASGQTLLISHNIDISTRIDTLSINDSIEFYGEYVWNSKGGLVHWTHQDPNHSHIDGYLKHQNITYD